jgi:hypothetical protein
MYLRELRTDVIILLECEIIGFCVAVSRSYEPLPEPCKLINGRTKNHDYERK